MTRARRNDGGAALVELPLVFIAFLLFALLFTALGQLFLDYHHVSGAARAAARYATKADYDPATPQSPPSRTPSANSVKAFAVKAAAPLPADQVSVDLYPDTTAGNGVDVVVSHTEQGGAWGLITGTVNKFLGLVGARPVATPTVHAHAVAIYE